MLNLKTILVPVDFSERSTAAAEHAVVMADRFGAALLFVHVIPLSAYEYSAFEGGHYSGALWPSEPEMEAKLAEQMDGLTERLSRPIEKIVLKGDPPTKIEQLATERQADLIMMPTHGYGPFRRFVLGSVTTKVLHDLSCPVFTGAHVPEIAPYAEPPYRRVACAVDLREHSECVLRWAWGFAQAWDAELSVIHAAPLLDATPANGQYFTAELRDMLIRGKQEDLDELLEKVGCQAKTYVECDEVSHFVPAAAGDAKADILIIGRTPLRGILGRLRTHAYALIREAPCPVISV